MQYHYVGASGLQVSALSLGTWVTFGDQLDQTTACACLEAAYGAGVNLFDTAEVYAEGRAEVFLGKAMKQLGWKRSDVVVSTKLFWSGKGPNDRGLSRKHILEGADASLARLQMDYIDLIYCPPSRYPHTH